MKAFALALLSIWFALPVAAQTVDAKSRVDINTFSASDANRTLTICLLADTQNTVSSDNAAQTPNAATDCSLASSCSGASCTSSPYCSGSWHNTGRILMTNLAYELTGQWDKIDYTAIDGNDNVRSKKPHPLDNGNCDAILSLGDMTDVPNNTGYGNHVASSAATLTSLGYDYQHETNKAFWRIIDNSGIPYVLNQGNHDPWAWWNDLFTLFGIESKSYFYDREDVYGLSYAALIPTRLGAPLCVVSIAFSDTFFDPAQTTRGADTLTWAASAVGCGGDYPTAILAHSQVWPTGALDITGTVPQAVTLTGVAPGATYAGTAGASEIFMVAGGHHTSTPSVKTSFTGLFGVDADQTVYTFFSNWQEVNRHDANDAGLGVTTSDGNGGAYTVVTIDANSSRICGHDWSPYWQARSSRANGQNHGAEQFSSICFDFDFDTRFP